MKKSRFTVSIDTALLERARDVVGQGRVESISALVDEALRARLEHEARLEALDALLAEYEAEHGAFSDEELAEQARGDRDAAAAVRARRQTAA